MGPGGNVPNEKEQARILSLYMYTLAGSGFSPHSDLTTRSQAGQDAFHNPSPESRIKRKGTKRAKNFSDSFQIKTIFIFVKKCKVITKPPPSTPLTSRSRSLRGLAYRCFRRLKALSSPWKISAHAICNFVVKRCLKSFRMSLYVANN